MNQLRYAQFHSLNLREIRPAGWIREYLERQCDGLTGHVEVSGYPFGMKFWGSADSDQDGAHAAWWPFEQTGYWIDGALKAGYLAGREDVYRRALEEVDYAVDHAAPDGFIGPQSTRAKDRWAHAVFFRAVLAQYEISGDPRYLTALARHYRGTPHPMNWDRDVTGVEILTALFGHTGSPDLLDAAEDLYARFNRLLPEHDCSLQTLASDQKSSEHGVTFNEIGKLGALLYSATGKAGYLSAAVNGYAKLERDQMLSDGMHSCSEHLRGRAALDSHETCDISDYTWSLGALLMATGDARYADRIERVMFNAAPGAVTKDFKALQYFSCPNQVIATRSSNHNLFLRGFNWMMYRPDHEVQCCPGNVHRAMPNFASRMWLRDAQGALVAALYGPGSLHTTAGSEGVPVTIATDTRYPFEQVVEFTVTPERPVEFALRLRIPGWCRGAALAVNGAAVAGPFQPGSFYTLRRAWQPGDRVRLDLPFTLRLEHWEQNGVSVEYGPLALSLPVETRAEPDPFDSTEWQRQNIHGAFYTPRQHPTLPDFPAWSLTPAGPWNYALCVSDDTLAAAASVQWHTGAAYPFDPQHPPLKVRLPARVVRGWELAHAPQVTQFANYVVGGVWKSGERALEGDFWLTPPLPDPDRLPEMLAEEAWVELVPYGCTLLRVTVFPQAL